MDQPDPRHFVVSDIVIAFPRYGYGKYRFYRVTGHTRRQVRVEQLETADITDTSTPYDSTTTYRVHWPLNVKHTNLRATFNQLYGWNVHGDAADGIDRFMFNRKLTLEECEREVYTSTLYY